jgi:acid stress chaperone HdeB
MKALSRDSSSSESRWIQFATGRKRCAQEEVGMKSWCLMSFLTLFAAVATSTAASAQMTIDVTKITCEQFLAGKVADSRSVTIWMSGYYHGMTRNTVLDVNALQQDSQAVMDYCIGHPSVILMDAVTTLFGKKK